jgi:hypothetical protein
MLGKKRMVGMLLLAFVIAAPSVYLASAHLLVTVGLTGSIAGQTKELAMSAQTAVTALGAVTVMPACAAAAASTFTDTAAFALNWGTTLQGSSKYETFWCIGNIGTSAGIVRVVISGTGTTGDGTTVLVQSCSPGLVGGITFANLDGATINGGGVIAVHVELDTPSVALNTVTTLKGIVTLTIS